MADRDRAIYVRMAGAIAIARDRAGLTQKELAARLGIEPGTLSTYETAARKVPIALLPKLARALGRPIGYFFGEPDPRGLDDEEQGIIGQLRSIQDPELRKSATRAIFDILRNVIKTDQALRERRSQLVSE